MKSTLQDKILKKVKEHGRINKTELTRKIKDEDNITLQSSYRSLKSLIKKGELLFDEDTNEVYIQEIDNNKISLKDIEIEDEKKTLTKGEQKVLDFLQGKQYQLMGDYFREKYDLDKVNELHEITLEINNLQQLPKATRLSLLADIFIKQRQYNITIHDIRVILKTLNITIDDLNEIQSFVNTFKDMQKGELDNTVDFLYGKLGSVEKVEELLEVLQDEQHIINNSQTLVNAINDYYEGKDEKSVYK